MARKMSAHFPEQLRVVGTYDIHSGHAWCVDVKGRVVDPTAHQFNYKFNYKCPVLEESDFPIGECYMCGEVVWKDTLGVRRYLKEIGEDSLVGPHVECHKALEQENKVEEDLPF